MNTQPYETPPQWWPPKMRPWWVRVLRFNRQRDLRNQRITNVRVEGAERLKDLLAANTGVLILPNHSFHYDSYCLFEAAERVGRPFHFLTAWQVFAATGPLGRLSLQWHGCFSINREGTDIPAFKQAVEIVQSSPYPLVIFPEGDIYHTNDRVTPFRDGAAAIALAAARKATRPIVCLPTALKCRYVTDPTPQLTAVMDRLEASLHWRPLRGRPLAERVYNFASGMLALKEIEYRGCPQPGTIPERTNALIQCILERLEKSHAVTAPAGSVPERVKELRRRVIRDLESSETPAGKKPQLQVDLDDLFLAMQLYSYPGDYVSQSPTIERIAETIDKFEEDVLRSTYPGVRGERHVTVCFGEPIPVPAEKAKQPSADELTDTLHGRVQGLLDGLHANHA